MSTARVEHTATLLPDGRVLIVGGTNGGGRPLPSTQLFDAKTNTWTLAAPLNGPRFDHTATLLADGRVLVTGGFDGADPMASTLATTTIYDPKGNSWSAAAPMRFSRARHTATLLKDGRVLVVGGISAQAVGVWYFPEQGEVFDPLTDSWSLTRNSIDGREAHTATLLTDGRVLIIGGQPGGQFTPLPAIYDPQLNLFAPVPQMQNGRYAHTATLLPGGSVLVLGGYAWSEGVPTGPLVLDIAEVYDVKSQKWWTFRMDSGRAQHTATLMPDGRVLVVGATYSVNRQAVLFDPSTRQWIPTGPVVDRYSHTATLLNDGRVLVAGGYSGDGPAGSVLYDPNREGTSPWLVPLAMLGIVGAAVLLALAARRPSTVVVSRWLRERTSDEWTM